MGLSDVHSCRSAELKRAEHRSTDWGSRPAIQTGIYFADADVLSVLWGKSRQSLYVPADLIPELMQLEGDKGGRSVLKKHECCYVEIENEEEFSDIDTEEQMKKNSTVS